MAYPDQVVYFTQDVANRRHVNGDPNTLKVGGFPGYTCQNWNNGRFYVYSAGAWHEVLTVGGSSPGNIGDILWHGPSGWTHQRSIDDQDQVAVMSWDSLVRFLYDASGLVSINFDSRTLVNSGSIESVSWNDGITVYDANSVGALQMTIGVRNIYDTAGAFSGDFSGRNLIGSAGVPVLNWNDGIGVWDGSGAAAILADTSARVLYDLGGAGSIDFDGRRLLPGNGPNANFTWYDDFPVRLDASAALTEAPVSSTGTQTVAPASGSTVTPATDATSVLTYNINIAAGIATLTVALKTWLDRAPDGARITIFARSAITTLTVTAVGYTVIGTAATTLAAGASIEYVKVGSSRSNAGTPGQLLRVR